jgi:hypothetical protein
MMIKKVTIPEILVLLVAIGILLIAVLTYDVKAQEIAGDAYMDRLNQPYGKSSAEAAFSINDLTIDKTDLASTNGIPGNEIDTTPGLQKSVYPTSSNKGFERFLSGFQELIQIHFGAKTQIETSTPKLK